MVFHEGGPYYIETSISICFANHWTIFCMIQTTVMKVLRKLFWLFFFFLHHGKVNLRASKFIFYKSTAPADVKCEDLRTILGKSAFCCRATFCSIDRKMDNIRFYLIFVLLATEICFVSLFFLIDIFIL